MLDAQTFMAYSRVRLTDPMTWANDGWTVSYFLNVTKPEFGNNMLLIVHITTLCDPIFYFAYPVISSLLRSRLNLAWHRVSWRVIHYLQLIERLVHRK